MLHLRPTHILIAISCFAALSCGKLPTEPLQSDLRAGQWNGEQIAISVDAVNATFATSTCLRGTMPRPRLNTDGTFAVDGSAESVYGPPPPPSMPAFHVRFVGQLMGNRLSLTATFDNGRPIGPFV